MPVVFVIAPDWTMRTAVRAQLREIGVDALGMDSPDDTGRAVATGSFPNVIVIEATDELLGDARIENLIQRVPAVVIASRTIRVPIPDNAVVLYRPVLVAEIVSRVTELLGRDRDV